MTESKTSPVVNATPEQDDQAKDVGALENTPYNQTVNNKYRSAATIANDALKTVIKATVEGASVRDLCKLGDDFIVGECSKIFKGTKFSKGISMPTCVSVNNCACHFSPLLEDPDVILKSDDVVKIDLGAHFDGYIATAAHTTVVGASAGKKVTGRVGDALVAANKCIEAGMRMIKSNGTYNTSDINRVFTKITESYGVNMVENMVSHQLIHNEIHGGKAIVQNPGADHRDKIDKFTFDSYDVFALDVLLTTGPGVLKTGETRTTVFKKSTDKFYSLKLKTARAVYSEASTKFGTMPFVLSALENQSKAKIGITECIKHGVMEPYHVMWEKDGEFVVQLKATVIILPGGVTKIAGLPIEENMVESSKQIQDSEVLEILKTGLKVKKENVPVA
uniref:Peptidase_M24 domain-containing protein n=1 Tax=Rhabditophanes sp. KR3021 TaxID=114890 RepID=A0AC35TL36_9BILA